MCCGQKEMLVCHVPQPGGGKPDPHHVAVRSGGLGPWQFSLPRMMIRRRLRRNVSVDVLRTAGFGFPVRCGVFPWARCRRQRTPAQEAAPIRRTSRGSRSRPSGPRRWVVPFWVRAAACRAGPGSPEILRVDDPGPGVDQTVGLGDQGCGVLGRVADDVAGVAGDLAADSARCVSAQHVLGAVAPSGAVRGESGRDLGEDVRVEHGDVERLVSAGVAGAVLPELDLDHCVSPGVPVAQPQVGSSCWRRPPIMMSPWTKDHSSRTSSGSRTKPSCSGCGARSLAGSVMVGFPGCRRGPGGGRCRVLWVWPAVGGVGDLVRGCWWSAWALRSCRGRDRQRRAQGRW